MAIKKTASYSIFKGKIGGLTHEKSTPLKTNDFVRELNFSVKTSDDNVHYVKVIQFLSGIGKDVYFSSNENRGETKKIAWDDRNQVFEDWSLIGTGIKAEGDEYTKQFVPNDAIDYILENFKDGDSVLIKTKNSRRLGGNNIYRTHEISAMYSAHEVDFKAEDFQEQSDFTDEFVFTEFEDSLKVNKIKGYHVDYKGNFVEDSYVIDLTTEDGKAVSDYFKKNIKYGSIVKVQGVVHNRAKITWVEKEVKTALVGKQTKSYGNSGGNKEKVVEGERKEWEILAIDSVQDAVYTKEDFTIVDDFEPIVERMPWE